MDELIKKRYELIIGIAALFISLSSFKNELNEIPINLSILSFSAKQYLFWVIISVFFSASMYGLKYLFYDKHYKILNCLGYISIFIFSFILISPTLIVILLLIKLVFEIISDFFDTNTYSIIANISAIVSAIMGLASIVLSIYISKCIILLKKDKQK